MTVVTGHWSAADAMDASRMNSTILQQNTFGNRPASDTDQTGKMFYATDTGRLYVQTSGGWEEVLPNDLAAGVGSKRTLGTGSTQAASGQHASAHEPGGGDAMAVNASAGTGSLRSLGTSSTTAAAGNHTHAPTLAEDSNQKPGTAAAYSTSSYTLTTSFALVPGLTQTITPGDAKKAIVCMGHVFVTGISTGATITIRVTKGGSLLGSEIAVVSGTTNARLSIVETDIDPAASSHVYQLQIKTTVGSESVTLYDSHCFFGIAEMSGSV